MKEFNTLADIKSADLTLHQLVADRDTDTAYRVCEPYSVIRHAVSTDSGFYLSVDETATADYRRNVALIGHDLVTKIPDWKLTNGYVKNQPVVKGGFLYRANSNIDPDTPFVQGMDEGQWTRFPKTGGDSEAFENVKSLVVDIYSGYGTAKFLTLGHFEFIDKDNNVITLTADDYVVEESSGTGSHNKANIAVTGIYETAQFTTEYQWISEKFAKEARLIIRFNNPIAFTKISYTQYLGAPDRQAKDTVIQLSDKNIKSLTVGKIPGSVVFFDGVLPERTYDVNEEHDPIILP